MIPISEINKQFENAGIPELKDGRNNAALSERLQDDEIIEMASIAMKKVKPGDVVGEGNYGLLMTTNIRALYINKGVMWGCNFE